MNWRADMPKLAVLVLTALTFFATAPVTHAQEKTLRVIFQIAETGFDPAQISDVYSRTVTGAIFESLLEFDYLARPVKAKPALAAAMPEISADLTTYTFKLKPGVYFADDPAFNGKKREVTAEDVVYSFKRHYDPKFKSYAINSLLIARISGLNELRTAAINNKAPFPYDQAVPGLKALDRYTVQFKLDAPTPRFETTFFTDASLYGIVAREVVEKYGSNIMQHPVGTGPFRLGEWRRSSRIVLEKNSNYREVFYEATPPQDNADLQALYAQMKGKRLPIIDRVDIAVIEEPQPRWLAFLNEERDIIERLPDDFANIALPNNKIADHLARRGVQLYSNLRPSYTFSYFNMEDPVVGGYTPEKVALRRAIGLAINVNDEIRLVRRGQAIPAQSPIVPLTDAYDENFRSELGQFDPARAKALLDMFGYVDKNGDGWRDLPDGSPLVLTCATTADQRSKQLDEIVSKSLRAVGIRIVYNVGKWPDNLKMARAGKLQMWKLALTATIPDSDSHIQQAFGPAKGENNLSRFDLPEYNAIYEKQNKLPDGPERQALALQAKKLLVAYAPIKPHTNEIWNDLAHAWVMGYRRHPFGREAYKYIDIDVAKQQAAIKK
jgi:ABC-type transport system substrate-binding protein